MASDRGSRNAERTGQAILDGTLAVLSERGDPTTIAEVAAAARISKGAVLHHFGTRDALLLVVTETALERFRKRVLAQIDLSENIAGKVL